MARKRDGRYYFTTQGDIFIRFVLEFLRAFDTRLACDQIRVPYRLARMYYA